MNRRRFLGRGLIGASALSLSACKILDGANTKDSALRNTFEGVGKLSYRAKQALGAIGQFAHPFERIAQRGILGIRAVQNLAGRQRQG